MLRHSNINQLLWNNKYEGKQALAETVAAIGIADQKL